LGLAGQVGDPEADMDGQLAGALDRIHTLLRLGDMDWPDIVRMTILTTDVEALLASWPIVRGRFEPAAPVPPNTLAQVTRFAHPKVMVEIDALAMN
jgi:enamine deaminase RidA (YjgF/YER057c/UK114 family)